MSDWFIYSYNILMGVIGMNNELPYHVFAIVLGCFVLYV
jgi:hypothetical protein